MSMASSGPQPAAAGSRESSEFEFVVKAGQTSPPNPLLLSSNRPGAGLPSPVMVSPISVSPPAPAPAPSSAPAPRPLPSSPPASIPTSPAPCLGPGPASTTVTPDSPPAPGMFGWVKGTGFLSRVVEKTRTVTENVITTLDPQMKEFIHSGGVEVVVASDKEHKVVPVREAFQKVFGHATVYGLPSKTISIAEQPVGYASGKQAAAERASQLRKAGAATANTVILAVENFLYEVTEELWLEMSCLLLSDPAHNINLVTYSQATVVEAGVIQKLKDGTPDNYPRQWSGFAVPVGRKLETRTD